MVSGSRTWLFVEFITALALALAQFDQPLERVGRRGIDEILAAERHRLQHALHALRPQAPCAHDARAAGTYDRGACAVRTSKPQRFLGHERADRDETVPGSRTFTITTKFGPGSLLGVALLLPIAISQLRGRWIPELNAGGGDGASDVRIAMRTARGFAGLLPLGHQYNAVPVGRIRERFLGPRTFDIRPFGIPLLSTWFA
jgi:hypothetical protein